MPLFGRISRRDRDNRLGGDGDPCGGVVPCRRLWVGNSFNRLESDIQSLSYASENLMLLGLQE